MLKILTANTPNGRNAAIMLEETELASSVHKIDLSEGVQHAPEFRRLNPTGKIPVLIDRDYLAGDYSIADIATAPWIKAYQFSGLTLDGHPHLQVWHDRLWQRPAVARGMDVPESGPAS